MICPYCNKEAVYISSTECYANGVDYGMMYLCAPCDARVGVHKGTNIPLGTLANKELREWRKKTHAALDPLWKNGPYRRAKLYLWIQDRMKLTPEEAHIGMFDIPKCQKLLNLIEKHEYRYYSHRPKRSSSRSKRT